jgi:hypothetical protein
LRFVWAVAAFVLAALLIVTGIAQRTVFLGPRTTEVAVSVDQPLPFTLVDGAVLASMPGAQTLTAEGEGELFAAYGRTADLEAWLSDVEYNVVTLDADGDIVSRVVEPEIAEESEGDVAADAAEQPAEGGQPAEDADAAPVARNPAGSDLWLDEFTDTDTLTARLQLPAEMSVLLAADGTAAAPGTVEVSWPVNNSTPWAGPLIVAGGIMMALGVFLYILGVRHVRRSRGPRRKGLPPLPETQPLETIPDAEKKGVISAAPAGRRGISRGRAFVALPIVTVAALAFSGCSAEAWPQLGPTPTPSPTSTVLAAENQQQPAVTETQAQRILTRIAQTVADADAAGDEELAATRLAGAVLDERKANYTIRESVADHAPLSAIPTDPLQIVLPQAFDGWPRTFMTVVADDADDAAAPTIAVMTQEDAWSPYKVTYLANLAAAAEFPGGVAPSTIGATLVPPDSSFLVVPPQDIAAAYADVLNNGENSESFDLFQEEGDQFRVRIAEDRRSRLETFNQTGAETGSLTFSSSAGAYDPVALATLESGAIVAVSVTDTDTVRATNSDAVIRLDGNPTVEALAGTSTSPAGFQTNFSDQLFFYVPNQADGGQIQLLGYASNILSAGVIQ